MKRFLKIMTGLILVASLAACAQIPHSSPVNVGPDMNNGLASDYLYYSPSGPSDSATPADIVNGFINAGTGPQNDYSVARQFLSKRLSSEWNPGFQTLVQTGRPLMTQDATHSSFDLTANLVTIIDSDGLMKNVKESKTLSFHLSKESGQWRIDQAPNMTLLIKPVFDVIFQGYSIYFLDKAQQHLVPDVRWFPSRASTGTKMVSALLEGPSDWLAPAVSSAIPAGTKLNTASVTIDRGVATVDLSAKALKASYLQKALMRAQIYQTLTQLPAVLDVNIEIDRSLQQISLLNQLDISLPSNSAFALINKNIYEQTDYKSDLVSGFHDYIVKSGAFDFALNENQSEIALLGKAGLFVAYPRSRDAALKLVDNRQNLASPAIDGYKLVWSMQADAGHGIRVFNSSKNVASFSPRWMRPLSNKHFAISPDNARLLVSGYLNGNSYLYGVGIVRNNLGIPILSKVPKLLAVRGSLALDINWVSQSDVIVSSYSSTGTQTPEQLTIGGESKGIPDFAASVRLAASSNGEIVYLLTKNNELYENRNQGWVLIRKEVSAIHFAH